MALNWEKLFSRRDFLKISGSSTALLLSGCSGPMVQRQIQSYQEDEFLKQYSPIDRTIGEIAPKTFSGDNNSRPHRILWDLKNYLPSKKLASSEEAKLVVVGGGMAGLFTAYQFRNEKPILLEQAPRFGGNAKGQTWRGMHYSLGSAYIDLPRPGTPMAEYYNDLGLEQLLVGRPESDPAEFDGKIYSGFWEGETEPSHKNAYDRMNHFFSAMCSESERAFPFIPALNAAQLSSVQHYDRESLYDCLSRVVGGKLPPHLETALEYYCWSTYAGTSKELSAAAALNFLAQESNPIRVGAGGNARIGERILERLVQSVPRSHLRASCLVVRVKREGERVIVWYEDPQGELREIRARAVVLSCPKFIASKILPDLEADRLNAIKRLRYRSYMTAHVMLKQKPQAKFYDLFLVGKGKPRHDDLHKWQDEVNGTDFVLANFADPREDISIFTFYRAFPFDGARAHLNTPQAYESYRKKFEHQLETTIFPMFGLKSSDIADLRLTVWGHALPLAARGIYSDDTIPTLRKPMQDRIFFIEQDNWAYPSTQTGGTESILLRSLIRDALKA